MSLSGAKQVLRLVCFGLLLVVAAHAQEPAQKAKAAPLKLKLRALGATLCLGTALTLELEVKNTSREVVKIDKGDLWSQFVYGFSRPDGSGRGGGSGSNCGPCHEEFIVLYPGMTYWDSYSFTLTDSFFKDAGKYNLRTSVNSVTSNDVKFELIDCGEN